MLPRLAFIAAPLILIGCVERDEPEFPTMPPEPVVDACGAAELQDLVGQPEAVASAITFAVPVRIIQPGMAVTMDFRADRLNIEIDEDGNIARIFCG